jgi:hypothetical protein
VISSPAHRLRGYVRSHALKCSRTLAMRVAQLESESRREKEVRRKLPALLSCAPFTPEALQERLADRADTSGLLKVCHTRGPQAPCVIPLQPTPHQLPFPSGHQSVCARGGSRHRQQRVYRASHCLDYKCATRCACGCRAGAGVQSWVTRCSSLQALSARVANLDCDRSISVSNSFLRCFCAARFAN